MRKQETLELFTALNNLGNLNGVRFAYGVSKNLNLLKLEIEALSKASASYEADRVALAAKYAKKNPMGEPVMRNNQFDIENLAGFQADLKKLQENKDYKEYQELLNQESDFKPYKIKLDDVPKEINVTQMFGLSQIVEDIEPPPLP